MSRASSRRRRFGCAAAAAAVLALAGAGRASLLATYAPASVVSYSFTIMYKNSDCSDFAPQFVIVATSAACPSSISSQPLSALECKPGSTALSSHAPRSANLTGSFVRRGCVDAAGASNATHLILGEAWTGIPPYVFWDSFLSPGCTDFYGRVAAPVMAPTSAGGCLPNLLFDGSGLVLDTMGWFSATCGAQQMYNDSACTVKGALATAQVLGACDATGLASGRCVSTRSDLAEEDVAAAAKAAPLSPGAVGGIAVGVALAALAGAGAVWTLWQRRRASRHGDVEDVRHQKHGARLS